MRIIGGKLKGKKLVDATKYKDLRPTTDRNRESLFNILSSAKFLNEIKFDLIGANILDICCGTGAVSFEGLSRGAKKALLIDKDREHLKIAQENIDALNLQSQAEIKQIDIFKISKNEEFFDLIFIDPPYKENYALIIENLINFSWIKKGSLIVIESDKNICEFPSKLRLLDSRKYGKTFFNFLTI